MPIFSSKVGQLVYQRTILDNSIEKNAESNESVGPPDVSGIPCRGNPG
jgi:hypothetical protein